MWLGGAGLQSRLGYARQWPLFDFDNFQLDFENNNLVLVKDNGSTFSTLPIES